MSGISNGVPLFYYFNRPNFFSRVTKSFSLKDYFLLRNALKIIKRSFLIK